MNKKGLFLMESIAIGVLVGLIALGASGVLEPNIASEEYHESRINPETKGGLPVK